MSGQLLAFPSRAAHPPAIAEPAFHAPRPFRPAAREYDLGAIMILVGMAHRSRKVVIGTLRKLADQSGMPLPKTPRVHAGRICTGPDAIGTRSRWDAMVFDAWLDGWMPPAPSASGPALSAADPALRRAMAARAAALGAIGRKRA
jgi:hypothetical protein